MVTGIARRAEIGPGQIYRWRRELRVGNGFAQVLIAPAGDDAGCPAAPAIEIAFAGKARMRIPASIPAGLAAAVVKAANASNWNSSPQYVALREKTIDAGLRRAGLPDE